MFEKIVVPLDSSKLAEVALPYAEELAGKTGSEVILLTVLQSEELPEHGCRNPGARSRREHGGRHGSQSDQERRLPIDGRAVSVHEGAHDSSEHDSDEARSMCRVLIQTGPAGQQRHHHGAAADAEEAAE